MGHPPVINTTQHTAQPAAASAELHAGVPTRKPALALRAPPNTRKRKWNDKNAPSVPRTASADGCHSSKLVALKKHCEG